MGLIVSRIQFAFLLINNFFNGNTASKYIFCVNGMPVYCIERIRYHVLL